MHRVATREDWARVRALRYEALASRGEIAESAERMHADAHDLALNSATFLLTRSGRAVGSTRSSVSSPLRRCDFPAMDVFGAEIQAAIGLECTVVEASLMVVDPATHTDRRMVLFHLLKAHMLQCASDNADWLVAAVRDDEIGFYRRMLNMEILSGAESCPGMATPRVLMGMECREQAPLLFKRIPVLAVTLADEAEYATSGNVRFAGRALRQQAA
ncbi:MAG: hypothetical protein H7Y14_06085 [Burkholderiales bacterium]|nr:hypothetical protein [Burkholderiales bacterium]